MYEYSGVTVYVYFNIYNSMTTVQLPSAEEDHVMQSKAPEQLLDG